MDFARKQLEKYGWSEGKGLGKAENGLQEALKPKHKRGSGGVGHDMAEEFTNHWWERVYNKAADNIEVETFENGEVRSISTKNTDKFEITTTKFVKSKSNKKKDKKGSYLHSFVKRATLSNGETKYTRNSGSSSDDDEDSNKVPGTPIEKLTDEELFAACGGRTAHKGARHGLKANGKLLRIIEHENMMLEKLKEKKNSIEEVKQTNPKECKFDATSLLKSYSEDIQESYEKCSKKNKQKKCKEPHTVEEPAHKTENVINETPSETKSKKLKKKTKKC